MPASPQAGFCLPFNLETAMRPPTREWFCSFQHTGLPPETGQKLSPVRFMKGSIVV